MTGSRLTGSRRGGLALALLAAVVSGVAVFLNSFAVKAFGDPTLYTTAKNLVAAVVLALVFTTRRRRVVTAARPREPWQWLTLAAVGVVGGSVPFVLFFEGLARTASVQAAFVHKTLVVWVALLALAVLRERLTWMHVAAIAVLVAGQAGLSGGAGIPLDAGSAMVLGATLLWAVEVVLVKRLLVGFSSWTVGLARMALGSVVLVAWTLWRGTAGRLLHLSAAQLGWVLLTGLILAAYVSTWFAALARAQAVDVTAVLVVGAVVTAALSALTTGSALVPQLLWLALLLGGAVLVAAGMLRGQPMPRLSLTVSGGGAVTSGAVP